MVSETGLDISKTLMFRGAQEKELTQPENEVCTYWTTEIDTAISYARTSSKKGGNGVVLVTTFDRLPNLNNLEQHIYPGTVVAFGKAPEIIIHFNPEEFDSF